MPEGRRDEDRAERRAARAARRRRRSPTRSRASGAEDRGRGVAVALDGEVVPRARVGARPRSPRAAGSRCWRRSRGGGRRRGLRRHSVAGSQAMTLPRSDSWELGGREWSSRLIAGTGGFRSLEQMESRPGRLGRRDRHRRPAPRRPRREGLGARRDRPARPLRPAQHRRLLHGARRGPHRAARPRGVRRPTGSSSR